MATKPFAAPLDGDLVLTATAAIAATQMNATAEKVPIIMGRRPSLSTQVAPRTA
jgi:hypothetical protein